MRYLPLESHAHLDDEVLENSQGVTYALSCTQIQCQASERDVYIVHTGGMTSYRQLKNIILVACPRWENYWQ